MTTPLATRTPTYAAMLEGAALEDVVPGIDRAMDDEVRDLLATWAVRYRGRPDAERRRLLLFALEREQIVTVAYREQVIGERLAALDVPPELRRLLQRTMAWIWRDEALHVDWVRGRLRGEHRPIPVAVLLTHQATGLVSGWVSTTRTHPAAGRRTADLVAGALVLGGVVTRQISLPLARELRGQGFGRYARLNLALERTAERCWLRLAELSRSPEERADVERIAADEGRHRMAFAAIAAVLDERDRSRSTVDDDHRQVEELAARLAEISPWFLPAERRTAGAGGLGRNRPVRVAGASAGSVRGALREALDGAGVLSALRPGATVAVRANFMLAYDRADRSNVVDPDLVDELARELRAAGAGDIAVLESPCVYDRYVRNRSVHEVAAYAGLVSDAYRIVDAEDDQVACAYLRGLGRTTISRTWLEADHRVVVAKAATDPVEFGHLTLCTLEGTAGRVDQTLYLGRLTDFRSATMMALDLAPPDLAVIDAWGPLADGPVGVMGSHRPCFPQRVYAGDDAIAVDLAALADMGGPPPEQVPMLAAAAQWLGVDLAPPAIVGPTGRWGGGYRGPDATAWSRLVCRLAFPVYTYGGAQGARFVPRFDADAFPDIARPRWDIRASRALAQRVFGLHPPTRRPAGSDPPRN